MAQRRFLAGRIVPALALLATLVAAPRAGAHRPQALAACAPLPDTLVSPEGSQPLAARSAGPAPRAIALDEAAGRVYINIATALLVLDATSGVCLRDTPLAGAFPGPIAVDGQTHLVFAARDASIVAFAGASGARLATVPAAARVTSLLADPAGDRVLGISDAELLVLDGRTGALLRRAPFPGPINGQVHAVALWDLGALYVAERQGIVVLDTTSGAVRRTIPIAATPIGLAADARTRHLFVTAVPSGNTPASSYSLLATFDAAGGTALSQVRFATSWENPDSAIVAVDGPRGHLFVSSNVSMMNVVDTRTGAVLASAPTDPFPQLGAVAGRAGQIFVANLSAGRGGRPGQAQGSLTAIDAATGAGRQLTFIGFSPSGLVVDQTTGRLFVTTLGTLTDNTALGAGTVLMFDISALGGAQRPQALAACAPLPDSLVSPEGPGLVAARSAGENPAAMALDEAAGRVYINTATALLALDAASGACLRDTPLAGASPGPIAVDGRTHLVFAARDTSIVAFAGASGARLATVPAAARVTSLLADPGGDRVLGISDAELLVLDGRTGALLRRAPLPSPRGTQVHAAALWSAGSLYVTEPRAIAVLDVASGALRRTIPLAAAPFDLAVDERTRHLFAIESPPYGATPGTSASLATFDAASGTTVRQIRLATTFVNPESAIVALDWPRGHLFVYSYASGMNMVDTRTGAVLASGPSDYLPLRGAVAGGAGQVFVANLNFGGQGGRPGQAQGSLSAFDAATGVGRHLSYIGYSPTGLVADETTGRLFVTTLGTLADNDGTTVAGTVLVFDIGALGGVRRPQALAACAPLPATLISPAGRGLVAARSAGENPASMALDEAAGRVYINTATALLTLDAASGACLRVAPLDTAFPGPIAVDRRTHVVFAVRGASIAAFAGASGTRLATVSTGAEVTTLLADPRADRVLGLSGAALLVLDGRTGGLLRRTPVPFPAEARVPVAALWDLGAIYVAEPRAIAVLDAASGALRRAIPIAATPIGLAADARTRHLFVTALPPGTMPASAYSLLATVDATSGAALHQVRFATSSESPDSAIVAVDGPRGHLFVSSNISMMNMVDTRTGAVLASAPTDPLPQLGAVAERAGRVFVANLNFGRGGRPGQAQGSLSAFDAATGAGRQLAYVGYAPTGLVADETTGRLFVTTAGTLTDNDQSDVAGTVLVFDIKAL